MLMTARKRAVPLNVIEETVNTVPGLIAIKDDICGHYGQHVAVARKGGVTLLSGDVWKPFEVYPYGSIPGCPFLCAFMPRIAWVTGRPCRRGICRWQLDM
ncbi:MAG: hypothetical protein ACLSBB_12950 [Ruthenibacterium lactatiformans]